MLASLALDSLGSCLNFEPEPHGVPGDQPGSAGCDEVVEVGVDDLALDDVLGADPAELEGDQGGDQADQEIEIIDPSFHGVTSFASTSHHSMKARRIGLVLPWSAQPAKPIQPSTLKLIRSRRSK